MRSLRKHHNYLNLNWMPAGRSAMIALHLADSSGTIRARSGEGRHLVVVVGIGFCCTGSILFRGDEAAGLAGLPATELTSI